MSTLKRGFEFTHESMLDPDWRPGPGEKHNDGPKARCVVTATNSNTVWYRALLADGSQGMRWLTDRAKFEETYADQIKDKTA